MLQNENELSDKPNDNLEPSDAEIQKQKKEAKFQKKAAKKLKKAAKKEAKDAAKEASNRTSEISQKTENTSVVDSIVQISRKPTWEYLIDLLIVILGVSISFALNEWRNNRNDTEKAEYLQQSIIEDLAADSTILQTQIQFLEMVIAAGDSAMSYNGETIEKKHINYLMMQFNATAMPVNNVTYKEMYQSGNADKFFDKSILIELNRLYNISYPLAQEWQSLEKNSVMNGFLPLINSRFPFAKKYAYTDSTQLQQFNTILTDPQVLNTIQSNSIIKQGLKAQFEKMRDEIRSILLKMNSKE